MNLLAQRIDNPLLSDRARQTAGETFIGSLITNMVTLILIVAFVIFFFSFILGGISLMQAGGDKVAVENARKRVLFSVVGVILVIAVFAVVEFVERVFGVKINNIDLTSLYL